MESGQFFCVSGHHKRGADVHSARVLDGPQEGGGAAAGQGGMSPRRRQRCRREREKGSRAHRSGRGDAAEPAARQFPFLQPSGAVVSVGRPLTLTGEVLPVCHGRKLSLLSLRPRGGREAWESFAGLIGLLSGRSTRRCTAKATRLSTTCSCCASTSIQTTRRARCSGGLQGSAVCERKSRSCAV